MRRANPGENEPALALGALQKYCIIVGFHMHTVCQYRSVASNLTPPWTRPGRDVMRLIVTVRSCHSHCRKAFRSDVFTTTDSGRIFLPSSSCDAAPTEAPLATFTTVQTPCACACVCMCVCPKRLPTTNSACMSLTTSSTHRVPPLPVQFE